MQQNISYNIQDSLDEELTIDLKKIFYAIWSRKVLLFKVFSCILIFFIILTFILPKKYSVDSDLYINNAQSTNLAELNPYMIENIGSGGGGVAAAIMGGSNSGLTNELELMQSPLVINNVIKENDLRFGKIFGIIPTKRTGEFLTAKAFLKKNISIENKKGTNVITIAYKSKKPEIAYGVVNSIIENYIKLHKELHSEKSKADKTLLEQEYKQAKANLDNKVNQMRGLPSSAVTAGSLSAMSAFSKSAENALSTLKGQVIQGQKSQIEVSEEAQKVASLSSKLEWAKLVDEMSDSSKVLVLNEPKLPRNFENSSPKLFTNILLGIVFGVIGALAALIHVEITDKKLSYSMLGEEVIYKAQKNIDEIKILMLINHNKFISLINFENIPERIKQEIAQYKNIKIIEPEVSSTFISAINSSDAIILFSQIGQTDSKVYKQTKEILHLLAKKEGIKIAFDDVKNMVAEGGSIGRPHIAKAITNAGGTSSVMEAYSKYIHRASPVYVERKTVTPFDAVEVIYDSGGIPVIAHPYDIDIAEKLIKDLMNCGLRGIEAYHRKHSPAIVEYFSSMAENLGLIVTGGSDFHAPNIMNGQIILGKNFVPEWIYDSLINEKKHLDMARG